MRLFLAINPAPGVRRAITEATSELRAAAPSLAWVDESRMHLTLRFLGEQPEAMVPTLSQSLDGVTARHRRFPMHIGEVGAFPNFRRARVVWIGVGRDPRLELLHHDVELACEALGFELEGRPFRPHLTLARVKERTAAEELRQLARASKRVKFEEDTDVESVDIMHSTPDRGGSRFERLHAAILPSR